MHRSMKGDVICRQCKGHVPPGDVNVAENVAYCRRCGSLSRLSEIVTDRELPIESAMPPAGCVIVDDGVGTTVRASTRSIGAAIGTLAICAFWNSAVSIFVALAISGTIYHATGAAPSWLPAPNMNGATLSLGMLIILWLFLTPFIAVGLMMFGAIFMSLAGRVQVSLRGGAGKVFTGCGAVGRTCRFDMTAVESVRLESSTTLSHGDGSATRHFIVIKVDREIRFGSTLPKARRAWMAAVLRRLLMP